MPLQVDQCRKRIASSYHRYLKLLCQSFQSLACSFVLDERFEKLRSRRNKEAEALELDPTLIASRNVLDRSVQLMKIGICLPYMKAGLTRDDYLAWFRRVDDGPFFELEGQYLC